MWFRTHTVSFHFWWPEIFQKKYFLKCFRKCYHFDILFFCLRLLSSWLQSLSAVILEPKKIKPVTASTFPPFLCNEVIRLDAMILIFFKCWLSSQLYFFKPLSSITLILRLFSSSWTWSTRRWQEWTSTL